MFILAERGEICELSWRLRQPNQESTAENRRTDLARPAAQGQQRAESARNQRPRLRFRHGDDRQAPADQSRSSTGGQVGYEQRPSAIGNHVVENAQIR